jgi:hypothetical protein
MMMDFLHRVMSGQSLTRGELIGAGLFVLQWWLMDLIQFIAWLCGRG